MTLTSLFYPIAIIVCGLVSYSSFRRNREYKNQNMEIIYTLKEDGKSMRYISRFFLIFMLFSSTAAIYDSFHKYGLVSVETFQILFLPIVFIFLYIPLSENTKITTIGIKRSGTVIPWDDIKGIDFLKPDEKGKIKAKILYSTSYKDMNIELVFNQKDGQLEMFKKSAKEYRNKKREKK